MSRWTGSGERRPPTSIRSATWAGSPAWCAGWRARPGAGIVGAGAGEMIAEGVLAIEMGAVARDVLESIHPHPTLTETVMEVAELAYGAATHVARPRQAAGRQA